LKTEYYGSYILQIEDSHVRLHYKRTLKDYWDILVQAFSATACSSMLFLFSKIGLLKPTLSIDFIVLLGVTILFGVVGFVTLKELFYLLASPRKNLFHFDQGSEVVYVKSPRSANYRIHSGDIVRIDFGLTNDSEESLVIQSFIPDYIVRVQIRTSDRKDHTLFLMSAWDVEEVVELSKSLSNRIAKLLNTTANFSKAIDG